MRVVTLLILLTSAFLTFWGGYVYSERRLGNFAAEAQRSCNLSVAENILRTFDLTKVKGTEQAEKDVTTVARQLATDSTYVLASASQWPVPSFGPNAAVAVLRERNDARNASLHERLEKSR